MAVYQNRNVASSLTAVEFIPRPDSNVAFFYLKNPAAEEHLKSELAALGQEVLGTTIADGKTILITRGLSTEQDIRARLAEHDEILELKPREVHFHPWEWRGRFSDIGQTLNLASAKFNGEKLEEDKLAFAALNLTANWVNKKFGAEKMEDVNRLHYLKTQVNQIITPDLPPGVSLPAMEDDRAILRSEPARPKSIGEKFHHFMQRNSVRLGEIGLRYLGSIALLLSYPQLKRMGQVWEKTGETKLVKGVAKDVEKLVEGFSFSRAWETMKKEPASEAFGLLNKNKTLRYTGGIYLTGKTLGLLFAKAPDPYNPKPKNAFDTFREKYAFRMSSIIEGTAAGVLAVGSFRKKDFLAAAGGTTVGMGQGARFFAPFGVREVDHKELNAHIVDSIAMVPPEKRAKALTQTAAFLKEHFGDEESYGQIFTRLKDKLYHDRGIALYSAPQQQPSQAKQVVPKSFVARLQGEPQSAKLGVG